MKLLRLPSNESNRPDLEALVWHAPAGFQLVERSICRPKAGALRSERRQLELAPRPALQPEPDIALARVSQRSSRERPRPDEIALIVEIADSSLAFDLGEKRTKYARAGIAAYWVVDVQSSVLHVFRGPNAEGYDDCRVAKIGETISPVEYPDVVIDLSLVVG